MVHKAEIQPVFLLYALFFTRNLSCHLADVLSFATCSYHKRC